MDFVTHFTIFSAPAVDMITLPLKQYLNNNYFEFVRIFPNGSRISLGTRAEQLEHIYFSQSFFPRVYTPQYYKLGQTISYFEEEAKQRNGSNNGTNIYEEHIKEQQERFNITREVHLINKTFNYCDIMAVGAPKDQSTHLDKIFSHQHLLERFYSYFKIEAKHLIEQATKKPVIQAWRVPNQDDFSHEQILDADYQLFCQHTAHAFQKESKIILTPRERVCLALALQGFTRYKDIAKKLHLSPRTVETYLTSIRGKFATLTISQVIEKIDAQGYRSFYSENG